MEERGKVKSQDAVAEGKMTFGDCLEVFKTRMVGNPDMKPETKEYNHDRIKGLVRSWPELITMDVSRVTRAQCAEWGIRHAAKYSSSSHNHTVSILRRTFEIALEADALRQSWLGSQAGRGDHAKKGRASQS